MLHPGSVYRENTGTSQGMGPASRDGQKMRALGQMEKGGRRGDGGIERGKEGGEGGGWTEGTGKGTCSSDRLAPAKKRTCTPSVHSNSLLVILSLYLSLSGKKAHLHPLGTFKLSSRDSLSVSFIVRQRSARAPPRPLSHAPHRRWCDNGASLERYRPHTRPTRIPGASLWSGAETTLEKTTRILGPAHSTRIPGASLERGRRRRGWRRGRRGPACTRPPRPPPRS